MLTEQRLACIKDDIWYLLAVGKQFNFLFIILTPVPYLIMVSSYKDLKPIGKTSYLNCF